MNPTQEITFQPFQPQDQAAVKDLILAGLEEHWGTLDLSLNPDLNDICRSYAGACFLVAWQGRTIVGCGALAPLSADCAQIVRMSVAAGLRRNGIGGQILARLCDHARSIGIQKLILETTATWGDVIAFYQRHGFRITHYQDGDVYFALDLAG